jgi:hypothetical protein
LNNLRKKFVEYGLEVFQKILADCVELNSSYMRTVEIVRCCIYEGMKMDFVFIIISIDISFSSRAGLAV